METLTEQDIVGELCGTPINVIQLVLIAASMEAITQATTVTKANAIEVGITLRNIIDDTPILAPWHRSAVSEDAFTQGLCALMVESINPESDGKLHACISKGKLMYNEKNSPSKGDKLLALAKRVLFPFSK